MPSASAIRLQIEAALAGAHSIGVSDALIAYQKDREFREQQEQLTSAAADADRLSRVLYQHSR